MIQSHPNGGDYTSGGFTAETQHAPASTLFWKSRAFAYASTAVAVVIVIVVILVVVRPPIPPTHYTVTFERLVQEPVLTYKDSVWRYNYNSAFLPLQNGKTALAVRVQNLTAGAKTIFDVGPSTIAVSRSLGNDSGPWSFIQASDAIILPDIVGVDDIGAEDPRIVLDKDGTYYMFFTAVRNDTSGRFSPDLGGHIAARLALATCKGDPLLASCWVKRGDVFPDVDWSKSGALTIRSAPPHYLLWGDSSIWLAKSNDLLKYNGTQTDADVLIKTRPAPNFDSQLVESGPPPLPLGDGNYLFLYNSARRCVGEPGCANRKHDWLTQYNLGWVVLDKGDPSKILQRSSRPILTPTLGWETCIPGTGVYEDFGLTPNVVFVEGWKAVPGKPNQFLVWYQGCDAFMGVGRIIVE